MFLKSLVNDAGLNPGDIKNLGLVQLGKANFRNISDLREVIKFELSEFKGCELNELLNAGFTDVDFLRTAGFTTEDFNKVGLKTLIEVGCQLADCHAAGVKISSNGEMEKEVKDMDEKSFKELGLLEFGELGITKLDSLMSVGKFTPKDVKKIPLLTLGRSGFTNANDLFRVGFTKQDFLDQNLLELGCAGFVDLWLLKHVGFTSKDFQREPLEELVRQVLPTPKA